MVGNHPSFLAHGKEGPTPALPNRTFCDGGNILSSALIGYLNGRKRRGTKEPLGEGEEESGKTGLKLSIQKTKIMASSPIIS